MEGRSRRGAGREQGAGMSRKAPTGPRWRLRVGRDAAVGAPRATLDVVLRKTAKGMSARVDLPDGQRIGVVAPDRHARLPSNGPLHRLCARLLERGVFVWHVAAPGAEMPVDEAPPFPAATATPRELARAEASLRAVEGFGVPQDILALSRDALALGFAPSITQIVRPGVVGCDWLIEVEGELPGDLVARMSLRGFRGRRSHGRRVYGWCSLPEEARGRLPPRIAPKTPAAPRRGPHRALPEGLA